MEHLLKYHGYNVLLASNLSEAVGQSAQAKNKVVLIFNASEYSKSEYMDEANKFKKLSASTVIMLIIRSFDLDYVCNRNYFSIRGMISESDGKDIFFKCLSNVIQNKSFISNQLCAKVPDLSWTDHPRLSSKELLIIEYLIKGHSSHSISKLLQLSLETIKVHRKNIRSKLSITGGKSNLLQALHVYLHTSNLREPNSNR